MKFCVHCGKECLDDAIICPACGCSVQYENNRANTNQRQNVPPVNSAADKCSVLSILGFVFAFLNSIAGLVLSIVAFHEAKKKTGSVKSAKLALAGIIISSVIIGIVVLSAIAICVFYIGLIASLLGFLALFSAF